MACLAVPYMCLPYRNVFIIRKGVFTMPDPNCFMSIFAPFMRDYLSEKEMQGFSLKRYKSVLSDFDRFLVRISKNTLHLTVEDIAQWTATHINDRKTTLYARQCTVSNFCSFMSRLGYECYVLKRNQTQANQNYRPPTVFTHKQMHDIFAVCDKLKIKKREAKITLMIMPALVRLLYSTGLRINEALAIRNRDVDFDRKAITINDSKNNRQRLAPINGSLEVVLKQYIAYKKERNIPHIEDQESHFFVSELGRKCSDMGVYQHFQRIVESSGIQRHHDQLGPSLHTLRHTSAVHALIKMTAEGKDLYCALPLLSVFLGHKSVLGTERYVRLTQEMYPEVLKMDMNVTGPVFTHIISKLQQGYENRSH